MDFVRISDDPDVVLVRRRVELRVHDQLVRYEILVVKEVGV